MVALVALVALASAGGAAARFVVDAALSGRAARDVPWGTLAVNTTGSLAAGFLLAFLPGEDGIARTVVVLGFLGSFTTFSTFAYQTVVLAADGAVATAARNVAANILLCVAAASLGLSAGAALGG